MDMNGLYDFINCTIFPQDVTDLNPSLRFVSIDICIQIIGGCIQKFPDWPPGARTANSTALCHYVQLYRYYVSQYSEICSHNPLCCFSMSVYC
jgi:hypothetical protein